MNSSFTAILRLEDARGRVILVLYGVATTLVATLNLSGLTVPMLGVLSLSLLWVALALLAFPSAERYGIVSTIAVVALVITITLISSWNLADPTRPVYANWNLGATTFVLLVVLLRGRRLVAWFAFAGVATITLLASVTTTRGITEGVNDVLRQSATLFIGTLFAIFLMRTSRTISALQHAQLRRRTAEAAILATTKERAVQNARLDRVARPALERILDDAPFTPRELGEFVLLEAALRDSIRAAGFSSELLATEAWIARARGLQVILLDDRGAELDESDRQRVENVVIAELRATTYGTVTARLSPHGRSDIATVVVDEVGQYRRIVVSAQSDSAIATN